MFLSIYALMVLDLKNLSSNPRSTLFTQNIGTESGTIHEIRGGGEKDEARKRTGILGMSWTISNIPLCKGPFTPA